jgi:hypothetical protein
MTAQTLQCSSSCGWDLHHSNSSVAVHSPHLLYVTHLICIHLSIISWCTFILLILRVWPCHPIVCVQVYFALIESIVYVCFRSSILICMFIPFCQSDFASISWWLAMPPMSGGPTNFGVLPDTLGCWLLFTSSFTLSHCWSMSIFIGMCWPEPVLVCIDLCWSVLVCIGPYTAKYSVYHPSILSIWLSQSAQSAIWSTVSVVYHYLFTLSFSFWVCILLLFGCSDVSVND